MGDGLAIYRTELLKHWRALLAASVGLSFGYMVNMYITSIFSPHLIAEFGWNRSQFALLGVTVLIGMVVMPVVGRLTDVFGVRPIATFGVVCTPLLYIAFSAVGPEFSYYFAVALLQTTLVGATTTSAVYSRIIAEEFDRSRGVALSLAACAPALTAAVLAPMLSTFIDAYGWRAGYIALAIGSAVGGTAALLLLPRKAENEPKAHRTRDAAGTTFADYRTILHSRSFQIITAAILFCNVSHTVIGSQLRLILLELEMGAALSSGMVSLFAVGIVLGRLFCGVALDHFPTHLVAAIVLGLPGVGCLMLATGAGSVGMIGAAVLLIGLSTGAELDIAAYLVMRFFPLRIYSTAYGMVASSIALSGAAGSLILGATLHLTGSYELYLYLASVLTIFGGAIFLMLPSQISAHCPDAELNRP